MTLEHLTNHLRYLGYNVSFAWFKDADVDATMLIIRHPYTNESAVLTVTDDGRLLVPEEAPSLAKLSYNFGLGVTNSGYLFPLNDIEGSVKEFLSKGLLQKLDAVLAFYGEEAYLLPANMADAVPPQVSVRQIMAYEEPTNGMFVMVYGPQVYRPLVFKKKAKNLFTRVNGNKPERVLADLWKKLLNGE
jgi:hypothetical protein